MNDATIAALVTAIVAPSILLILQFALNRGQVKRTTRKDLMDEVDKLWSRIDELQTQLKSMNETYNDLVGKYTKLQADYAAQLVKVDALEQEVEYLREMLQAKDGG